MPVHSLRILPSLYSRMCKAGDSLAQYISCGCDISSVLGIEQMKLGCEHIGALVHYYYYYYYYYEYWIYVEKP